MKTFSKSALLAAAALAAALSAPAAQARRGADDAAGDVRQCRGCDDPAGRDFELAHRDRFDLARGELLRAETDDGEICARRGRHAHVGGAHGRRERDRQSQGEPGGPSRGGQS